MDPNNDSMQNWFNNIPSPESHQEQPPEMPHKHALKKRIVITACVVIALTLSVLAVFLMRNAPLACLSSNDYKSFTGHTPDKQSSLKDNFYTTSLAFNNATSAYHTPDEAAKTIKKIGRFYQQYSDKRSVVITITSDYTLNDTKSAADARTRLLRQALQDSGVKANAIKTQSSTYIDSSEEIEASSPELTTAITYLSISSDSSCAE